MLAKQHLLTRESFETCVHRNGRSIKAKHKIFAIMAKETKLVALTTETENELQVNEQAYGWIKRVGRRAYAFFRRKKNPTAEEVCHTLAKITHGKIYANGYGVTLRLYVKHTEYNTMDQLADIIMERTKKLTNQL